MSSAVVARDTVPPLTKSPPSAKSRNRPTARRLAMAGAALAVLAGGAWYGNEWWTTGRFIESTDDAYVGGDVTAIAPHVAGFVEAVLVSDNQRVTAGQLLVRLDQRDFRAAEDHARAVVDARLAALDSLRAEYFVQQSAIRQQEADFSAKSAQASFAEADATRYRSLALTAAGSRQDAQRTTAADQTARSAVAASVAGLEAARQKLNVIRANITEAEASVAQARADLQTASLNLGWTEIRSPIDGYVGNRAAQVGAYAGQGSYLISVIPSGGLWVDANFKEDQLSRMDSGRSATVVADVLPGHVFHAHVVSVAPGTGAVFSVIPPENATGNFTKIVQRVPVRVVLDPGDDMLKLLRPGLSTTVSIDTRDARKSVP
jgi:membrane fusion protein (multidrug efflux system)